MRVMFGLAVAAIAAILFLGCGSDGEGSDGGAQETTSSATFRASAAPRPTAVANAAAAPTGTPRASYTWIPPTPEVPREELGGFWFGPALEEDSTKPRITQQVVNGILIGATADFLPELTGCPEYPDGASTVHPNDVEGFIAQTAVDVRPSYLPMGVESTRVEAAECRGVAVTVAKWYTVETRPDPGGTNVPLWSGGGFTITRRLTDQVQAFAKGVAERVHAATLGGHPAVVVEPLTPRGYDIGVGAASIVISDGQTIVSIQGDGLPFGELLAIGEGLYASK